MESGTGSRGCHILVTSRSRVGIRSERGGCAGSGTGGSAGTITSNELQTTFTVTGPIEYRLQGSLAAFEDASGSFSLFGEGIDHFNAASSDSIPFDVSGTLASGEYVLVASIEADLNLDLAEKGTATSRASFAFDFSVGPSTPSDRWSWGEVKARFVEGSWPGPASGSTPGAGR